MNTFKRKGLFSAVLASIIMCALGMFATVANAAGTMEPPTLTCPGGVFAQNEEKRLVIGGMGDTTACAVKPLIFDTSGKSMVRLTMEANSQVVGAANMLTFTVCQSQYTVRVNPGLVNVFEVQCTVSRTLTATPRSTPLYLNNANPGSDWSMPLYIKAEYEAVPPGRL